MEKMHFGVAFIKFLCFICDRTPSRSFSGQIKWEIGLTFNQNINPEEKRGFAYIVLKILSVKKRFHQHIWHMDLKYWTIERFASVGSVSCMNPSYFTFQISPVDTCEEFSFVSSSFVCDHWGGWRSHANVLK